MLRALRDAGERRKLLRYCAREVADLPVPGPFSFPPWWARWRPPVAAVFGLLRWIRLKLISKRHADCDSEAQRAPGCSIALGPLHTRPST